ncbi:MAG: glycosyltransferase 87 family protein [Nocardioides sp.]
MCYSDLPYLYTGRGLAELNWPYTTDEQVRARYDVMEYPVGISYYAWATAWVTHCRAPRPRPALRPAGRRPGRQPRHHPRDAGLRGRQRAWLCTGHAARRVAAGRGQPRRPWDAAAFAVSPALLLSGLINWDLLAVVLVAGALWAWARGRPVLTGVMIGLGTATKLYPRSCSAAC